MVTNDALFSLYAWHVFHIWKTFCQETIFITENIYITSWHFLIDSVKIVEVSVELSEDCCCDLSVPIPNEQTSVVEYGNFIFFLNLFCRFFSEKVSLF